jgi:hypothetical protein
MRPGIAYVTFPLNEHRKIQLTEEEESVAYDQCLQEVIDNPRYYLDNLEHIKEFQVSWLNYRSRESCKKRGANYAVSYPKRFVYKLTTS